MELSPEQIEQMISMLKQMLDNGTTTSKPKNNKKPSAPKKPNLEKSAIRTKKTSVRSSESHNRFEDMPEKAMHKEDIEIDKKLHVQPPVPRHRKSTLISVQCRTCGRKEKVSRGLVMSEERYKCNKCSISPG